MPFKSEHKNIAATLMILTLLHCTMCHIIATKLIRRLQCAIIIIIVINCHSFARIIL